MYIYVCVCHLQAQYILQYIYRNTFTHCWKCLRGLTQLLVSPQHRYGTTGDNSGAERSTPRTHSCKAVQGGRNHARAWLGQEL